MSRKHDIPLIAGIATGIGVFTTVNTVLKENVEARSMFHSARIKTGRLTMASAAGFKTADAIHDLVQDLLFKNEKRKAGPAMDSNHGEAD